MFALSEESRPQSAHELVGLVRRLSFARTVPDVMTTVTKAARALLAADGITFVLRDKDLCYYADEDAIAPLWKGKRFPMSACISGWAMLHKTPAVIEDIYQDARIPHDAYRPTFVKSLAMVPVRAEEPIAAIGAYWRSPHLPAPDELELLEAIADASALAIANVELQVAHDGLGRANAQLAVLLRELNHRVKNNLQMIASLIRGAAREGPPESRPLLRDITRRIGTIGQAYDQIWTEDPRKLDLAVYLQSVCRQAMAVQAGDTVNLRLQLEPVIVEAETALPVGLIVGELITNALKHAFSAVHAGEVLVRLERRGDHCVLTVRDDGVGLPSNRRASTLGLKLVQTLARQLRGRLYMKNRAGGGAQFRLVFQPALATDTTHRRPGGARQTRG